MFKHLTIKSRLVFVIAFLAAELVTGAVIGIHNLGVANAELKNLYDNRLSALGQLSRVMQLNTSNQLAVATAINAGDSARRDALLASVEANGAAIVQLWKAYEQTDMSS